MGAGFVRFGGVSAILVIAVIFIMIIVGALNPALMQNKIVVAIFLLAIYGLIIVVYLATKALWNRFGRSGANIPIIVLILMTVVFWILNLLGGAFQPASSGQAGAGVFGYVFLGLLVLHVIAWFWLSIYCIVAGNSVGGVWKAAGILYLIGTLVGVIAAIVGAGAFIQLITTELANPGSAERAMTGSRAAVAGIMALIGGIAALVLAAAWICHAIGLFLGAGKMERTY